jgi:hypothetical protein
LIQRPALRTVIEDLRSNNDFVVIEAPPVLATADTAPLTRLAEMILLVCNARKSTRTELRAALRELEEATGKLIGCVLYNVGHRRWLGRPQVPEATLGPPESGPWSRADGVDGQEVPPLQPTTRIDMTTGPSL